MTQYLKSNTHDLEKNTLSFEKIHCLFPLKEVVFLFSLQNQPLFPRCSFLHLKSVHYSLLFSIMLTYAR